jgi:NAD-dependent deacetylase
VPAVLDPPDLATRIARVSAWLDDRYDANRPIVFLTGAGISAESGVPTFRGEEGYWRIGSREYFPEELATRAAFSQMPDEIWGWYLYRRSICRAASPNAGHLALAECERELTERGQAERFTLVTQNVDGLHLRAGNSLARTFQIHGNIDFMRSMDDGDPQLFPLPKELGERWDRGRAIGPAQRSLLVCPPSGHLARPHVLWFDESYDEARFKLYSTLRAVERAGLVVVVGTSGATNLPSMVVQRTVQRNTPLLVINRDPSPFSELATRTHNGLFVQGPAGEVLPNLVDYLLDGHPANA